LKQSNQIIETLFFKCYYAYLKGDLEKTALFYTLLKEEYRTEGSPGSLNPHYLKELAKVKSALDGGSASSKGWLEGFTQNVGSSTSDKVLQKDLVRRIHDEGAGCLRQILEATDKFFLYNIEHPCDQYGYVDMYYQDGITAFPLEVKVGQGDHRLLGQIMKYDLYCRFHLHEKFYVRVQPVTVCKSYDEYTLSELKRNGVVPVLYGNEKTLRLRRV